MNGRAALERARVAAEAFAATPPGRLVVVALSGALLAVTDAPAWPAVALVLLLLSLFPRHRRRLVTAAAVGVLAFAPPLDLDVLAMLAEDRDAAGLVGAWPLVALGVVGAGAGFVALVRARPKSPAGRRPVLLLLAVLASLFALAGDGPLRGAPWFVVSASALTLASYVWFLAYAAVDARSPSGPGPAESLGFWRPFWGFSHVPVGKGAAYLARVEARDEAALAAAQVSGLALMAWAALLAVALEQLRYALQAPDGALGPVPPLAVALDAQATGEPFPRATLWASVLGEFAMTLLHMMAWGHRIVATARVAGFAIAPNTDRPLLASSVADFYNRYYFYFKELLATFFFYPAFLRFFRGSPRPRLFVATFAAAGFGNFVFHFFRDGEAIVALGFVRALAAYHVYACYAAVLGVAVAVSQLRLDARRRARRRDAWPRRALATAVVVSFYCLLNVLDARTPHPLPVYLALYGRLFLP